LTVLRGHQAPLDYHRRLLEDPHRVEAFERALRARVRPGDVVLDAGAGTGILAMLAARLGAARVHAVESMPVARLARDLVRDNRLEDVVIVHEADLVTLPPIEPVDLVVGDFLGAFLVDDAMLDAVDAAARWLRPGGGFIPDRVRLRLAPAGGFGFPAIDFASGSIHGVSLRALKAHVFGNYRADLRPELLLAPAALFAEYRPAEPCLFDRQLGFTIERGGRLRGLAGWFEADLAPSVTLSTAPGIETHWGQSLFAVPTLAVEPGDVVSAHLRLAAGPEWEWWVSVRRGDRVLLEAACDSRERFGERPVPPPLPPLPTGDDARLEAAFAATARAGAAREEGRAADALAAFEEAVRLAPPRGADAAALSENLAIGCLDAGRPADAVHALLRALDGNPAAREPSLRMLVYAFHDSGRHADAARALAEYQRRFGEHPLAGDL
jgi:SAM-dependent methyltransferase